MYCWESCTVFRVIVGLVFQLRKTLIPKLERKETDCPFLIWYVAGECFAFKPSFIFDGIVLKPPVDWSMPARKMISGTLRINRTN